MIPVRLLCFTGGSRGSDKSITKEIIIGAAAGGAILLILSAIIGVLVCQKKRAQEAARKSDPFGEFGYYSLVLLPTFYFCWWLPSFLSVSYMGFC